ncbi:class I SAM-dependent methyltransferase [Leptolyngbya sp. FACHB-16]|uniref:class I SAM-dependent methyltransferase n=1 Tax=unclassified Leptolyngbya TaxID=2650499 RepID=UPI001683BD97|nr:class I SAM-dependent methyltransferase [Leptolyngbya sp. FACHB-16]MBD2157994.1 class I SAM-dependent methyltransferase [Leptolyngbya sp. FACHB-16]
MKHCCQCSTQFHSKDWECPECAFRPKNIDGFLAFSPELALSSEGFEAHFFNLLVTLESNNFWFRARNHLLAWALETYFPNAKSFLEIGCGTGFVLSNLEQTFPHLKLQGSEIFTTGLKFAAQRLSRASLFQMDARSIPFTEEFDVIGAFDVLEHIQDDTRVLSEMYRASQQGILLTVPQHSWLWSRADDYAHHVRRYEAREIKTKVEAAGFRIVRMTSFVSLLLPLMLVSRLREKGSTQAYDPAAEFQIASWLNATLEAVMAIERQLIQAKLSLPLGGSLLVVAQKV